MSGKPYNVLPTFPPPPPQVFPDVSVAPSLMVGGTDTNHYSKLTKNIYRFLAVKMNVSVLATRQIV